MASPKVDEVQCGLPDISNQEASDALDLARQTWRFILDHLPEEARIS